MAGNRLLTVFPPALLGFKDEASAFVEIDAAVANPVAGLAERYGPLENVVVQFGFRAGRFGTFDAYDLAKFRQEQGIVGAFRTAGAAAPARDKFFDRFRSIAHNPEFAQRRSMGKNCQMTNRKQPDLFGPGETLQPT